MEGLITKAGEKLGLEVAGKKKRFCRQLSAMVAGAENARRPPPPPWIEACRESVGPKMKDYVNDDDTACAGHAGIAGVPCQRQDMQGTQLSREPKTRTDSHWYSPVSPLQRPSSPWSSSVRAVNPAPCMAQHVEQSWCLLHSPSQRHEAGVVEMTRRRMALRRRL